MFDGVRKYASMYAYLTAIIFEKSHSNEQEKMTYEVLGRSRKICIEADVDGISPDEAR